MAPFSRRRLEFGILVCPANPGAGACRIIPSLPGSSPIRSHPPAFTLLTRSALARPTSRISYESGAEDYGFIRVHPGNPDAFAYADGTLPHPEDQTKDQTKCDQTKWVKLCNPSRIRSPQIHFPGNNNK